VGSNNKDTEVNKLLIAILVAALVALAHGPAMAQSPAPAQAQAESVPSLLAKANQAYADKDYGALVTALEHVHSMRPYNSEYMYRLVLAYALLDNKPRAYELMLRMQQQGLAYDLTQTDDSTNIRGTEVFDYVNNLMLQAAKPLGEAQAAFSLPLDVALPGGMDWDPTRQAFLVGTLDGGRVLAVDGAGQARELLRAGPGNPMWAVLDLLVDEQRDRLWITSAAIPAFGKVDAADRGKSGLFEFELGTLKFIRGYPVPVDGRPHGPGSMAMAPGGDIYIADRALPIVYVKRAGEDKLTAAFVTRDMISLRDIAMQPDGRLMYIAGREKGITVVDLVSQQAAPLVIPETLNLGGIDGMFLWNNHLVIVQNGIKPQRVMRLALDASGTKVEAVRPLAVALPVFDTPSFGTVMGDDLYYFANGRWTGEGEAPTAVTVVKTGLDSNADLVSPEMELFLEQQRQQQAEREQQKPEKD
jgi:hypothetical protein